MTDAKVRALLRRMVDLREKKWLSPPIRTGRGGIPLGPSRRWADDEVSLDYALSEVDDIAADAKALLAQPAPECDDDIHDELCDCNQARPHLSRAEAEAMVDEFEYKIRCETMDTERGMHGRFAVTPEQVDAARQRVRELYEAVVRERDAVKADNEDGGVGALSVVWVNEDWQDEFASWYQPEQWMGQHRAVSAFLSRKVREMQTELAALRAERDYLRICLGEANASKEAAHEEVARLRAERDALVPLARWALFAISEAYARESNIVSRELLNEAERAGLYDPNDMDDVMDNMPKIIAARRIVEGTDA